MLVIPVIQMELFVARGGIEPPYTQSSNPYLNKLGFLYYSLGFACI